MLRALFKDFSLVQNLQINRFSKVSLMYCYRQVVPNMFYMSAYYMPFLLAVSGVEVASKCCMATKKY